MIESPARFFLGTLVTAAGAFVAAAGWRLEWRAIRTPATDAGRSLALMQAFRVLIIGLSLAALGIAWTWQIPWLAILALVVVGEETFETTMAIGAIRHGRRLVRY